MKLKRLEIKNYRSLKDVKIDFNNLTVLIGKNDSGKSSVLKAIEILFKWIKSQDFKQTERGGGQGGDLYRTLKLRDFQLFFNRHPGIIELIVQIELSEKELDLLFPDEKIIVKRNQSTLENLKDNIGKTVDLKYSITADEESNCTWRIEYVKMHGLEIIRPGESGDGKRILSRTSQSSYEYVGPSGQPISKMLFEMMDYEFQIIPPERTIKREERSRDPPKINGDGIPSNYLSYEIDASRIRERKHFEKIRSLISTMSRYQNVAAMEDGEGGADVYCDDLPSSSVGDGLKQQFVTVFNFVVHQNNIFGIEEPEIHLHPEWQRTVSDFLIQQSTIKQLIVTTHSPIIASRIGIQDARLVSMDDNGITRVMPVNEDNVNQVIDELGIKSGDSFENDVIVFVEGPSDVGILQSFASKCNLRTKVGFIDTGGWTNMKYFANCKVLQTRKVKTPVFAIFDGDTSKRVRNKQIKEKMMKQLDPPSNNLHTLTKNSIESYLLVPRAIEKAFPKLGQSQNYLKKFFAENTDKINKKDVLDLLFRTNGFTKYEEKYGQKIANEMTLEEVDQEISDILTRVSKAY